MSLDTASARMATGTEGKIEMAGVDGNRLSGGKLERARVKPRQTAMHEQQRTAEERWEIRPPSVHRDRCSFCHAEKSVRWSGGTTQQEVKFFLLPTQLKTNAAEIFTDCCRRRERLPLCSGTDCLRLLADLAFGELRLEVWVSVDQLLPSSQAKITSEARPDCPDNSVCVARSFTSRVA